MTTTIATTRRSGLPMSTLAEFANALSECCLMVGEHDGDADLQQIGHDLMNDIQSQIYEVEDAEEDIGYIEFLLRDACCRCRQVIRRLFDRPQPTSIDEAITEDRWETHLITPLELLQKALDGRFIEKAD